MPWRDVTPLASTPHACRWPGWHHCRPRGCEGGRPRHGGTPVHDETVTAGDTQLSGGPVPRPQVDHRIVAALLNVTCWHAGPGGQVSIPQRAHTISSSPTGPEPDPSARRPLAFPMVKHARGRSGLRCPSPTDRREGGRRPRQPRQLAPTERQRRPARAKCGGVVVRRESTRVPRSSPLPTLAAVCVRSPRTRLPIRRAATPSCGRSALGRPAGRGPAATGARRVRALLPVRP
jgi:hypothetical protein